MTITTGTDVIRAALKARDAKVNLGSMAKNIAKPLDLLTRFLAGQTIPTTQVLQALCHELWAGGVEFDPEIDRLRPSTKHGEPKSITPPPAIDPEQLLDRVGRPEPWGPHHVGGVQLPPVPPPIKRPGWA